MRDGIIQIIRFLYRLLEVRTRSIARISLDRQLNRLFKRLPQGKVFFWNSRVCSGGYVVWVKKGEEA